jgi:hypothetical protein
VFGTVVMITFQSVFFFEMHQNNILLLLLLLLTSAYQNDPKIFKKII